MLSRNKQAAKLDQVSALWDRVLGRLKAFVED
jgi:hypothetical protein